MALNPQSFFNFAAQNYPLLHDLFRRDGGMNDAALAELIRRHRVGWSPRRRRVEDGVWYPHQMTREMINGDP